MPNSMRAPLGAPPGGLRSAYRTGSIFSTRIRLGRSPRIHVKREHAARLDHRVRGLATGPPSLPLGAVDLPQVGAEAVLLGSVDVDLSSNPMDHDGQLFADRMGGADRRPGPDMAEPHRLVGRAEPEPPA